MKSAGKAPKPADNRNSKFRRLDACNGRGRLRRALSLCVIAIALLLMGARAHAEQYNWSNFAGNPGASGTANGVGNTARFNDPWGVAVDETGNAYVADMVNCTIRKTTPAGVVTTLAGSPGVSGTADGAGGAARFNLPAGVAVDGAGNVYVADTYNQTIRKVTPGGVVTTLAGSPGISGTANGTGSAARFYNPWGIAADLAGNVYVADTYNYTIRKVTPGGVVTTLAGSPGALGTINATGTAARFTFVYGIAVDRSGNVYVSDNTSYLIRKVTSGGVVTTMAGSPGVSGTADGTGSTALFYYPGGIAVDGGGNVYVADFWNHTIRMVTPDNVVTTIGGTPRVTGTVDGVGAKARFAYPSGVAVSPNGTLYVADSGNNRISQGAPPTATYDWSNFAGSPSVSGTANGVGNTARFNDPWGIAVDETGNAYVADMVNCTIRKTTPDGVVTTLAGSPGVSGTADGTGGVARFNLPAGVAVDGTGNVYVADTYNQTIRKVTPGGVVTTLAGSPGISGTANGTGSAARFYNPWGIAVDSTGNVYVADTYNYTIRKVTPGGVVTTMAGNPGALGTINATGTAARFTFVYGIAVDGNGNVYVSDNTSYLIRKVTSGGVVTTMAGSPGVSGTADGTGSAARFYFPGGIAVDGGGNVYAADFQNHTIRMVTPDNVVTTIGGTPRVPGTVDGVSSKARFAYPSGVAVSPNGTLYVADSGNNRISRGMLPPPTVTTGTASGISYENATLNGAVNPNGLATTFCFQYGLTADYGSVTTPEDAGADTSESSFSAPLYALNAATTYHYRIVATNGSGQSLGLDQTFTTANPPPVVVTGEVIHTTANGTTLGGTVNPSGLPTIIHFEYGLDATYGNATPTQNPDKLTETAAYTVVIDGLSASTTYHYRIVAANSSGTSDGLDATFTTGGPPVVTTGAAIRATASSARLGGSINPNGLASTYYFEYGKSPSFGSQTTKVSAGSGTGGIVASAAIAHLSPNTTYYYQIVGANTSGTVSGVTQKFTTAWRPMVGPGPAAVSTVQGALVSGTANPNGSATTVYFQYGEETSYGAKTANQNAGDSMRWAAFSATISGLKSNKTYHYRIVATNGGGAAYGPDETFTTATATPDVSKVTVSGTGETIAKVEASVNAQQGATNVYFQFGPTKAYGKTSGASVLEASGSDSTVSADLFALAAHTTYHVRCVARNAQGTSVSEDIAFKTLPRSDMDGDGFSELLLSDTATGETTVLAVASTATSGTLAITGSNAGPVIPEESSFCGQAEFNRNGTIGWVVSGSTVNQTQFWTLDDEDSGNWTSAPLAAGAFSFPKGSVLTGIADINGDGNPDLVVTGSNRRVSFYFLNGLTITAKRDGPILPAGFVVVGLDDLNGNGKPDLLTWRPATRETKVLALNGISLVSTTVGPTLPVGWQLMGANVFTGTGTPNWLLYNPATRATQIWVMQGVSKVSAIAGPTIPADMNLMGTK